MEGCEACLIDASKVILFLAGQDGWGSVVSSYPILSHSIPSQAIIHPWHSPTITIHQSKNTQLSRQKIEGRSIFHGARPAKMI